LDNALEWLKKRVKQGQSKEAEQYIRKAPPQTDTQLRQRVRRELGWANFPGVPCGKLTKPSQIHLPD